MSDVPHSPESTACVPQLLEAMRAVGSGLGLHATLERICATAVALTDAAHAAIGVVAEGTAGFADLVHHGVDEESARWAQGLTDGHEALLSQGLLDVPVRVHGEVLGTLYLAGKRGGGPFTEHDVTLVRVLATEAGIAIGNARLYEAARQRERWIDGSVAVTTALLSGGDIDGSLRIVAEQARRLSGAAAGIVLLPADEGGLEIVAVDAEPASDALGVILPPESEIVAELLDGEPVFVADAATDPRLAHVTGLTRDHGPTMLLPLQSDGRVVGSLAMLRARGEHAFTETERALAVQFAAQAALALMMAEAQRDRERLAVYEDRDRIARDLHDLVIQRLFATGMMLESAQRGPVAPEVRDGVGRAVDELDVTIQEIRTAIFALEEDPGEVPSELSTRVEREVHMAAVALGFKPSLRVAGPVDTAVGEPTGKNLVAALREGLSNAFRHAGASRIDVVVDANVTLPDGRPAVRLTVADDGVGIPQGGRRSGLRNLKRRAESLGGDSRHGPGSGSDGGGTTVVWQAPY
ncbi:GAF domain-containing sensor histidine kinase [Streptomyces sp. NPDC020898]|uniref:GAF domain-containing sensor histidine kinase n=1 Tax=Streptomyces sp. NPDC020898 TaxID=3365101 RepID=UPI0037A6D356